jgi:hypothetical protein
VQPRGVERAFSDAGVSRAEHMAAPEGSTPKPFEGEALLGVQSGCIIIQSAVSPEIVCSSFRPPLYISKWGSRVAVSAACTHGREGRRGRIQSKATHTGKAESLNMHTMGSN